MLHLLNQVFHAVIRESAVSKLKNKGVKSSAYSHIC